MRERKRVMEGGVTRTMVCGGREREDCGVRVQWNEVKAVRGCVEGVWKG